MADVTNETFDRHRAVATQVEALYVEIDKLARKRPGDSTTGLIAKKINHAIDAVRRLGPEDEFLDAIESAPVQGDMIRMDEALIVLSELRASLDRQWDTDEFKRIRRLTPVSQLMR